MLLKPLWIMLIAAAVLSGSPLFYAYAQSENETTDRPAPEDILATAGNASAGDLLVAPTRVVFNGRNRSTEVILRNQGNQAKTYRLSLVDLDIDATGNMQETEDYSKSAKKLLRFSPRQVMLEANTTQKVKVLLRAPSGLEAGEYRSHLKFQALPDKAMGEDIEASQLTDGLSVKLIPLVGLTIPVVAQHGELSATATISAKRAADTLNITINRSGNRSIFGDVYVKQDGQVIAAANTSVLLPMTTRHLSLDISKATSPKPLTIELVETGSKEGKPIANTSI